MFSQAMKDFLAGHTSGEQEQRHSVAAIYPGWLMISAGILLVNILGIITINDGKSLRQPV
jgi:hypothetical protein